jgi:hypothetical protein
LRFFGKPGKRPIARFSSRSLDPFPTCGFDTDANTVTRHLELMCQVVYTVLPLIGLNLQPVMHMEQV